MNKIDELINKWELQGELKCQLKKHYVHWSQ